MRSDCDACYDSSDEKNQDCSDTSGFILPINTHQKEPSNYSKDPTKQLEIPSITAEGSEKL